MLINKPAPIRLLIADEVNAAQIIKECFTAQKLPVLISRVHDSHSLFEYLNADKKKLPQLILLDPGFGGANGFQVLAAIKKDETFRKIPVIIFSTNNATHDIERSYELGASSFVSKPKTNSEWCVKISKIGRFWTECGRLPQ